MSSPRSSWHHSLTARFGLYFTGFVVVGSLLLLVWLREGQMAAAERSFLEQVHTDAAFVLRLKLPRSEKLAGDLTELLGFEVYFRSADGEVLPVPGLPDVGKVPTDGKVHAVGLRRVVALRLDASHDMIFTRFAPDLSPPIWQRQTQQALVAFWLVAGGFGWLIAWTLVQPVSRLTRGLKGFFESPHRIPAEVRRRDEIGELARALTQAREDLMTERSRREQSERLALLGRVATGLAHEIKNPLAAIQLHAQLMDASALDVESAQSLEHMQAEARVIEGLVNQWLFLTRPAPPKKGPLKLAEVVQETLLALRAQATHADVVLRFDTGADLEVQVLGDRARLQQAIRNVMLNAIQAMPSGGVLEVRLEQVGPLCRLLFHDGGPGFSAAALENGDQLFYSEKEGGMGVGLNVVAEIISAHEGRLVLKNHPQGGAVVEMELRMMDKP